jgi:G5 domain
MALCAVAALALLGGGTAGVLAATSDGKPRVVTAVADSTAAAVSTAPGRAPTAAAGLGVQLPDDATRGRTQPGRASAPHAAPTTDAPAAAAADRPAPPPAATPAATVTTRIVTETREIPYRTRLVRDPSLPRGRKREQSPGVPGQETLRYQVTYVGGRQTGRRLLDATVTRQPQDRVVAIGVRRAGPGTPWCGDEAGPCIPTGRSGQCERLEDLDIEGSITLLDEDLQPFRGSDVVCG